jgi:hypothetical protein
MDEGYLIEITKKFNESPSLSAGLPEPPPNRRIPDAECVIVGFDRGNNGYVGG